jgi:hypothetical protein
MRGAGQMRPKSSPVHREQKFSRCSDKTSATLVINFPEVRFWITSGLPTIRPEPSDDRSHFHG